MNKKKVVMSLHGLDGNAFYILAAFSQKAKKQGWTKEEIDAVVKEAQSEDYRHLLETILLNIEEPEEP